MALQLLNFTSGNVDLGIVYPSGTASISLKCVIGDLAFRMKCDFQTRKTLCSGIWEARVPQNQQGFITATKMASQGAVFSDPLALFNATAATNVTFTANTGCTITGAFWAVDEAMGGSAGGQLFAGSCSFESFGALSSTWVTT